MIYYRSLQFPDVAMYQNIMLLSESETVNLAHVL